MVQAAAGLGEVLMKRLWRLTIATLITAAVKTARRRAFRLRGLAVIEKTMAQARDDWEFWG